MPTGHYRFRRSLGNVGSLFRGARPDTYPLFSGLLDQYVGAAAAYSLRTLAASWLKKDVVEVRRASDNTSEGFTEKEITDGTLVDWVNEEIELPLDTASGAAAAYSLRNLSTSYTGNVVDVRRSSDDTEDSFTAAEVADGTLVTWVGAGNDGFVAQWHDQSGNGNHATQGTPASQPKIVDAGTLVSGGLDFDGVDDSFTLTSGLTIDPSTSGFSSFIATKFDKAATGSAQVFLRNNNSNPKHAISFNTSGTFRYNLNDGTNNLFADTGSDYGDNSLSLFSTIITGQSATGLTHFVDGSQDGQFDTSLIGDTGSTADAISWPAFPFGGVVQEIIFYPSDQSANRTAFEANIGETYGIDLPSGVDTGYDQVDGFVETWYDQSGNGNDAVQETASQQPKIVSGGSLVSGGIDFDGVDDVLGTSLVPPNVATLIGVANWDVEDQATMIIGARDSTNKRSYLSQASSGRSAIGVANSALLDVNVAAGDDYLLFGIYSSSTLLLSTNGTVASDSPTIAPNNTVHGYSVGALNTAGTDSSFMDGTIAEVIIYDSDQSANRVAIETNINNQYDIY